MLGQKFVANFFVGKKIYPEIIWPLEQSCPCATSHVLTLTKRKVCGWIPWKGTQCIPLLSFTCALCSREPWKQHESIFWIIYDMSAVWSKIRSSKHLIILSLENLYIFEWKIVMHFVRYLHFISHLDLKTIWISNFYVSLIHKYR